MGTPRYSPPRERTVLYVSVELGSIMNEAHRAEGVLKPICVTEKRMAEGVKVGRAEEKSALQQTHTHPSNPDVMYGVQKIALVEDK